MAWDRAGNDGACASVSSAPSTGLDKLMTGTFYGWMDKLRLSDIRTAKFGLGQVVRHRVYPFRGVIFDVDPSFNNSEEWYESIPEDKRPDRNQPFYHLFAENNETEYIAYVSEQNLVEDTSGEPLRHPMVEEAFEPSSPGRYRVPARLTN